MQIRSSSLYKTLLCLLSAGLFVLAFPPYDWYPLLWFAFVPLLIALEETTPRQAWIFGVITGTAGIMAAYPWLTHVSHIYLELPFPVNYIVWIGYAFIHSQAMGFGAWAYRYIQEKTRWHPLVTFPPAFTAAWSLVPTLFFFNFANGTTPFATALQPMEIFGTWGLDFTIIVTSTLVYSLVRYKKTSSRPIIITTGVAAVAAWFIAGGFLLHSWQEEIATWQPKRIGIVQSHRPSSRYVLAPAKGFSTTYPLAMDLSMQLLSSSPDIIIWPEGNLYRYFEDLEVHAAFMENVKKLKAPLLFHDYPFDFHKGKTLYRNASVAIDRDGRYTGRYNKRHLVPFGEYIPFLDYDGKLAQMFKVPPPLTPGDGPRVFDLSGMKVQPLICYEVQFTEFVAQSVGPEPAGKVVTIQSNDGWYGTGGQVFQHNSSVYLRAVEHRLPLVHVLNNGPSLVVLPDGSTHFKAPFWERGSWVVEMPYNRDSGGTFYSRHPGLVLFMIRGAFFLLLLYAMREKFFKLWQLLPRRNSVSDSAES